LAAERRALIRHALWPAGVAVGIAAESIGRPPLPGLDAATGFVMIALGLLLWQARPRFAVAAIMTAAGFAWFLGTLAGWAVYLHRGPLAQLMLTYPARRLWPASRLEHVGVVCAYAYAVDDRVAGNDQTTIVFALVLLTLAARRYLVGGGPGRRARASSLAAAAAFAVVLILGAALRLGGVATGRTLLAAYEIDVLVVAAGLSADLLWGAWTQATVTALVVDLGEPASAGTLRDRLARTLGDPTLAIGYWLDEQDEYVDEAGRSLVLPAGDGQRAVQLIEDAGRPLAALIHDPAVLDDPELLAGITATTRLAVANARLQAEVRRRLEQVKASRRRLVEAADQQRRQLERELRQASEQRLTDVAELLADDHPLLAEAKANLTAARAELHELARGIHPATLTDAGLTAALTELAARSPIPVKLTAPQQRWPAAVEAGGYFICSEALANIAKYARATTVLIEITNTPTELHVEVTDDGIGGANPAAGSGLRGLTDRAEALGGHLTITSPLSQGTRLTAQLPLPDTP
jgi:signal transduction histidine kinase